MKWVSKGLLTLIWYLDCYAATQLPQSSKYSKSVDLLRKSLLSHVWRVPSSKALSCKHERLFDLLTLASSYNKLAGNCWYYADRETYRRRKMAGALQIKHGTKMRLAFDAPISQVYCQRWEWRDSAHQDPECFHRGKLWPLWEPFCLSSDSAALHLRR